MGTFLKFETVIRDTLDYLRVSHSFRLERRGSSSEHEVIRLAGIVEDNRDYLEVHTCIDVMKSLHEVFLGYDIKYFMSDLLPVC